MHAHDYTKKNILISDKSRSKLAKMLIKLFDLWDLDTATQLILLGLSPTSRSQLGKYRDGNPLSFSQDLLDRAGWLLAIHQALRTLYPENPEICYSWIKMRNLELNNLTPIEYMKNQGLIGIAKIARFLQFRLTK